jgi:hypothetical protein
MATHQKIKHHTPAFTHAFHIKNEPITTPQQAHALQIHQPLFKVKKLARHPSKNRPICNGIANETKNQASIRETE